MTLSLAVFEELFDRLAPGGHAPAAAPGSLRSQAGGGPVPKTKPPRTAATASGPTGPMGRPAAAEANVAGIGQRFLRHHPDLLRAFRQE